MIEIVIPSGFVGGPVEYVTFLDSRLRGNDEDQVWNDEDQVWNDEDQVWNDDNKELGIMVKNLP